MSDTHSSKNEPKNSPEDLESVEAKIEVQAAETAVPSAESLVEEWKSKAAYLAADMENMKKRFARERVDTIKYANESLLKALIPVLDNLSLALHSAKVAKDGDQGVVKALVEGVEMTIRHFEQTLAQVGVEFLKTIGESFDPEIHEAVGQMQDAGKPDGSIVQEVQRGFRLSGRVVRTAKVIVNKLAN